MQQNDGDHRSDKGCEGKIGAGTSRSQMPKREHEQHQTDANPEKAQDRGCSDRVHGGKLRAHQKGEADVGEARCQTLDS